MQISLKTTRLISLFSLSFLPREAQLISGKYMYINRAYFSVEIRVQKFLSLAHPGVRGFIAMTPDNGLNPDRLRGDCSAVLYKLESNFRIDLAP